MSFSPINKIGLAPMAGPGDSAFRRICKEFGADYAYTADGGTIGETCAVALLLGGVYLLVRRVITWHIPAAFIGTVFLTSFLMEGMSATAALAAEALIRELHARGYEDIVITSGYRDYAYQQVLFNTYLGNEMAKHPDWTEEMCRAEVLTYSALPGESEHQTGLAIDFNVASSTFDNSPGFKWMKAHAEDYGFILRYPKDKTAITGIMYESWHWRFVGINAAKEINAAGLTLEEYLEQKSAA